MSDQVGFKLPGEGDDKCCWCLPIKVGVYLIGIFMVLGGVMGVLAGLTILGLASSYFIWGVLYLVAIAPIVMGAIFFIKFFRNPDDADARLAASKACMLCILSNVIMAAIVVLMMVLTDMYAAGGFVNGIMSPAINSLFYFYYAGVCKRYAGQA